MKLVQTLNLYLKSKTDSKGIFRYSRGPQFGNIGFLFTLVLMFTFILLINQIVYANFLSASVLLLINLFLLSLIGNVQGFEIDVNSNKIRNYKQLLTFRYGEWSNLDDFKLLNYPFTSRSLTNSGFEDIKFSTTLLKLPFGCAFLLNLKKNSFI